MISGSIASGRLKTVLNTGAASATASRNGGFAYAATAGALEVDTAAVSAAVFRSGIALKPSGVVFVTTADPGATSSKCGGFYLDADGALHVHVTDAVTGAVGSIPTTAKGAVAVSAVT